MTLLRDRRFHTALGIVLGAVFVYASFDKIRSPSEFARIIYHYRLIGPDHTIGPWAANLLAITLPWIELVTGFCLMAGWWRREAAMLAAGMLTVFIAAVSSALVRGIDIENCGCFSVQGAGRGAGIGLILGDLALLAMAWVLLRYAIAAPSPSPDASAPEASAPAS